MEHIMKRTREYVDAMRLGKGSGSVQGKGEGLDGIRGLTRDLDTVYWAVNGHG